MADRRVAFIVANANYAVNTDFAASLKLKAPLRDADAFRNLLINEGGFKEEDVKVFLDVDQKQLKQELASWKEQVKGSSLALFVYSGHGVDCYGDQYLMCTGWAGGRRCVDVDTDGVSVQLVQGVMQGCEKGLIIWDACRAHVVEQVPLTAAPLQQWVPLQVTRGGVGGAAAQPGKVLTALACLAGGTAMEQADQGIFTAAVMRHLFQGDKSVLTALSDAAATVIEATSGRQSPLTNLILLHPDFVMSSLAKAKAPVINLTYVTGWKDCYIRYTVDDTEWWTDKRLDNSKQDWTISIEGQRLRFTMHNGKGDWDNKDKWHGEMNYEIWSPGDYKLEKGVIKEFLHVPAIDGVELQELSDEELQKEAAKEEEELQDKVAHRAKGPGMHPKGGFIKTLWRSDRIWVLNSTGKDILVYTHRFRKIKETVEEGLKLSGGMPGQVGVEVLLKQLLDKDLIGVVRMRAGDTGRQLVYLGSRSGGAYVTACSNKKRDMLFCRDVHVKGGWCIDIKDDPFKDSILGDQSAQTCTPATQAAGPAATAAGAGAPATGAP